jgi:hypothetical protein
MPDDILSAMGGAAVLVHLAALAYVAGYLIRDQFWMRMVLFIGPLFYILYYQTLSLWEALWWSVAMGVANVYVMVQIYLDRRKLRATDDELTLFAAFPGIEPGDFRRIMKIAHMRRATAETALTTKGVRNQSLFFVLAGTINLNRGDRELDIEPGCFIGEVGFLRDQPASATASVQAGALYVEWDLAALRKLSQRNERITRAFERAFNLDLAAKLADYG